MAELQVKRRPIRAALYGLMLGFSIWYFLQFEFATFSFDRVAKVNAILDARNGAGVVEGACEADAINEANARNRAIGALSDVANEQSIPIDINVIRQDINKRYTIFIGRNPE